MTTEIEMITILKEEYDKLKDDQLFLMHLQGAGVDNWEGYDIAVESYQAEKAGE